MLLAALEVDGELHQLVETEAGIVGCSGCGTRAVSKGRRRTKVRDLSCGGRPVVVVWDKRLWRCPDADCDVKSWSETSALIGPRASMSERARVSQHSVPHDERGSYRFCPSSGAPAIGAEPVESPGSFTRERPYRSFIASHTAGAAGPGSGSPARMGPTLAAVKLKGLLQLPSWSHR